MHVEIMAGIYSGAWVTLGAGKSEGDGGGFFDKVPDRWLEETVVDVGGEEGQIVYVRPGIDHPDADWPAQEVLPLMKRGWYVDTLD